MIKLMNLTKQFFSKLCADHRGGALHEFAITIPVVLVTIFGIIDFSRYLSAKSLLTYGAGDVAQLASTFADLDKEPTDSQHENPTVQAAVNNLINRIKTSSSISRLLPSEEISQSMSAAGQPVIEVKIPPGPNRKDAMLKQPIEIIVRTKFSFVTPLIPDKTIEVRGLAYRELGITPSAPVAVDCRGFPISKGLNITCPCQHRPTDPTIVDPEKAGDNGDGCGCLSNLVDRNPDPAILDCGCSSPNMVFSPENQECLCNQSTTCPLGQTYNNTTCQCEGNACNSGQVFDGTKCQCDPTQVQPGSSFWQTAFMACLAQGKGLAPNPTGSPTSWQRCDCGNNCPNQVNAWSTDCGTCPPANTCVNAQGLPCEGNGGFFHYTDPNGPAPTNLCVCKIGNELYTGDDNKENPKLAVECAKSGRFYNPRNCSCNDCRPGQVVDPWSLNNNTGSWCWCGNGVQQPCWDQGLRYKDDCSGCDSGCPANTVLDVSLNLCICSTAFRQACAAQGMTLLTSYGVPAYSCACNAAAPCTAMQEVDILRNDCVCKFKTFPDGDAYCQSQGNKYFDAATCTCKSCTAPTAINAQRTGCQCATTCPAGFAQNPSTASSGACDCYCEFTSNHQPVNGTCPPQLGCTPESGGGWTCGGGNQEDK